MKAKILITGAAGFIGHNLFEKLSHLGHPVLGVDSLIKNSSVDNLNYLYEKGLVKRGLVFDENFLAVDAHNSLVIPFIKQADYIIYSAVVDIYAAEKEPELAYQKNILSFTKFLFLLKDNAQNLKRLILLSSSSVYGNYSPGAQAQDGHGFVEDDRCEPVDTYAYNKLASEIICKDLAGRYRIPVTVLRLTNVYSGNQSYFYPHNGVIFKLIDSFFRKQIFIIHTPGSQTRDFIHMTDVYKAVWKCLNTEKKIPNYEIYNIGTDSEVSLLQAINKFRSLMTDDLQFEYKEYPEKIFRRRLSYKKFENAYGWQPQIQILQDGLTLAIDEYKNRHKIG